MSRLKAGLLIGAGGLALFGACQTPTSITFVLRTDVDCSQTTPPRSLAHVVFGKPKAVESPASLEQPSSTKECAVTSGQLAEIGTLVALPRDDEEAQIAMVAVLGVERPTGECGRVPDDEGDPWGGCIVSRRRLGFIDGAALEVDVPLYFSCVGVPCDAFSTCVPERGCVDSKLDPNDCIDARCGDDGLDGGTSSGATTSSSASSDASSGDASSSDASASVTASDASSSDASSSVSSGGGEGGASVSSGGGGMSQGGGGSSSSDGGGGSTSSDGGGGSSAADGGGGSSSSDGVGGASSSDGVGGASSSDGGGGSTSSNGGGGTSPSGGGGGLLGVGGIVEGVAGGIAVEAP